MSVWRNDISPPDSPTKRAAITEEWRKMDESARADVASRWWKKLEQRAAQLAISGEEMPEEEWQRWMGECQAMQEASVD